MYVRSRSAYSAVCFSINSFVFDVCFFLSWKVFWACLTRPILDCKSSLAEITFNFSLWRSSSIFLILRFCLLIVSSISWFVFCCDLIKFFVWIISFITLSISLTMLVFCFFDSSKFFWSSSCSFVKVSICAFKFSVSVWASESWSFIVFICTVWTGISFFKTAIWSLISWSEACWVNACAPPCSTNLDKCEISAFKFSMASLLFCSFSWDSSTIFQAFSNSCRKPAIVRWSFWDNVKTLETLFALARILLLSSLHRSINIWLLLWEFNNSSYNLSYSSRKWSNDWSEIRSWTTRWNVFSISSNFSKSFSASSISLSFSSIDIKLILINFYFNNVQNIQ